MKVLKKFLSVIGAFLATLITPLLIGALMLAPVANTVSSIFTGDFIANLVTNVDVAEMVEQNEDLKESLEKADVKPEQIEVILKSEAFGEVIELYTEDLAEMMAGNRDESEFTTEALKDIVSKNMNGIVETMKETVPAVKDMTDEEIEEDILNGIDEAGEELVANLPKAEDMKEMVSDIPGVSDMGGVIKFMQKSLMPTVYGIIAGLALLIFLFRIVKFKGMLWDGIIFTGVGALMFVAAFGLKSGVTALDENVMEGIAETIAPFISSFTGMFLPFAIAYTVIGVLLIGGFITLVVLRRSKQKKLALAAAAVAETAVANEAPVAEATTEAAEAEAAAETAEEAPAPEEAAETTEEAAPEEEKAEEAEKTEEAEVK